METNSKNDKIVLEKFDCLDKEEILVAKKIVEKYLQKMEKIAEIERVKLKMRAHSKTKVNSFEVSGYIDYKGGNVLSEKQDVNPFVAIDYVMDKMLKSVQSKVDRK